MKNTKTSISFNAYVITLKFNEDYFDNPNEKLIKKVKYVSSDDRTLQEIQRNYPNAKVINTEKISLSKNYSITDFMSNYNI